MRHLFALALAALLAGCAPYPPPESPPMQMPLQSGYDPDEQVLEFAQVTPELVGGLEALNAAVECPWRQEVSRVIVRFVVRPNGQATDVTVPHSVSLGLDNAAIDAVERARFTPAVQNGEVVAMWMALPVTCHPGQ